MEIVEHAAEDDLERYAMRTLPAAESERLDEHLLVCSACRDRQEATNQYVASMRSAAAKIRDNEIAEYPEAFGVLSEWSKRERRTDSSSGQLVRWHEQRPQSRK